MSDLISRKAAIDTVLKESNMDGAYGYMDAKDIVDLLNKLPSAQRTGRWNEHRDYPGLAYLCSECNYFTTVKSYYCPYCGARMEE